MLAQYLVYCGNDVCFLSQRPTYVEVGPLMTTRSGEVRWSTAVGPTEANDDLINADLTALIWA